MMTRPKIRRRAFFTGATAVVMALSAAPGRPAGAGDNEAGFKTAQPSMLEPRAPGASVSPILSVGDRLPGGYRFESIPDGIALRTRGKGRADVYVNHETSLVPFPFNSATGVGQVDHTNALLSQLNLNQHSAGVMHGTYVIPSEANFQRFCSNFIAEAGEGNNGFERTLLFTNEEATDLVNRTGVAWPAGPDAEQAGLVVAFDVQRRQYRPIYGMGRHNHENTIAVPGYGHPVLLSGDDTFAAPASQLYLYRAGSAAAVWNDEGALYAFQSNNSAINDYGDLSGSANVSGRFIAVPRAIALGDQNALESWSNANNVFQFIRVEDIAFDRSTPNVVYFADTGEPRAVPDTATGRLRRAAAGTLGPYPNGRMFKMVLDPQNELNVLSLSILIDADAGGYNNPAVLHNPDNVETTARSVLIQEDPGAHNSFAAGAGPSARVWRYDLATGSQTVVAEVDQSLDPAARAGAWESTGIVDASEAFGPGAFLVNVQAHTILLDQEQRGGLLVKREGGQLVLLRIPNA